MEPIKNNHEQYLNWLAGADHSLTQDEINEIRAYLFSKEADVMEKVALSDIPTPHEPTPSSNPYGFLHSSKGF